MSEGKAVRFDVVRINRDREKLCRCKEPHYEIDMRNRLVRCVDCGAIVDPYEALYYFAAHYERLDRYLDNWRAEQEELAKYVPRRKIIKWLEEKYNLRTNVMLPTCPECGVPFRLDDLRDVHWVNENFVPFHSNKNPLEDSGPTKDDK